MARFRKKPVEIEAVRCSEVMRNWTEHEKDIPSWLVRPIKQGKILVYELEIVIYTLEGNMTAKPEDWIIRGVKGEIYPCKPDIFEMTYEAI